MAASHRTRNFLVALAASLLVHLYALHVFSLAPLVKSPAKPRFVELVHVPDLTPPEPAQKDTFLPEQLKGQVVDLGPATQDLPPDDARFLSERNMRVDRETVKPSRSRTGSPNRPSPTREETSSPGKNPLPDTEGLIARNDAPKRVTSEDLKIKMSDLDQALNADDGSIDYLPGVARGDITALNARRYEFAGFYNRLKKIIRFYWDPWPELKMINWTGRTLETRLRIVLSEQGELEEVEVVKSCGYPVVDAAALRAVKKAAPFFNVPKGLLNEQGKLDEVWAFYIVSSY